MPKALALATSLTKGKSAPGTRKDRKSCMMVRGEHRNWSKDFAKTPQNMSGLKPEGCLKGFGF